MLSEKDLATSLFRHFCTPKCVQCGWYREIDCEGDVWKQPTHKRWLEKVRSIIKKSNSNIEQIVDAVDTVNEVKKLLEE